MNAGSRGTYEEQQKLAADGLRMLCEYGDTQKINVIVENHGGLSSNAEWLVGVMKLVDHKRVGIFRITSYNVCYTKLLRIITTRIAARLLFNSFFFIVEIVR